VAGLAGRGGLEQVEVNAGEAALSAHGLHRGVSSDSSPPLVDLSEALDQADAGDRDPV
jgi:hypothetical protein